MAVQLRKQSDKPKVEDLSIASGHNPSLIQNDQVWLENRIRVSVDDDFYLDREEEKRIKEEAASRNILIDQIESSIKKILDNTGSVNERILINELDRILHQFTDNKKSLDKNEEKIILDRILKPDPGKKRGLDFHVAIEYVDSFCKINAVTRGNLYSRFKIYFFSLSLCMFFLVIFIFFYIQPKPNAVVIISNKERVEIDFQLERAKSFIKQAQYTEPPERSVKFCVDKIRQIDPEGQYRGAEVDEIVKKIVVHYLQLADKSFAAQDPAGVSKWLERANLMGGEKELIREKERALGLVKKN